MPDAVLELPLTFGRHSARVHARQDSDGGFTVSTEVDGREIASDYCPDWRRVERFCTRMQQWLTNAAAQRNH